MNITFLGGSFDPPHLGHLKIAKFFINKCDLFLFIPAKKSPFKPQSPLASNNDRIRMLELLIRNLKNVRIDSFELNNNEDSFTYLTVEHILKKYNPSQINMVIGADHLNHLDLWKNMNFIKEKCNIYCVNRRIDFIPIDTRIQFLEGFNEPISSTQIRLKIQNKNIDELSKLLDSSVLKYIINCNLYKYS